MKAKSQLNIFEQAFKSLNLACVARISHVPTSEWFVAGSQRRAQFYVIGSCLTCNHTTHEGARIEVVNYEADALRTTVGAVCQFIHAQIRKTEAGDPPPTSLKGATDSGSFEDLITKEGDRLSAGNILSLGRYPVASVMISGIDRPIQVPSLPDFEGVFPSGRQFIFEAKVCSEPAFPVNSSKLKPRQIRHMLRRSTFNVPCFLLIHFNARLGKTSYSPAATYALPVKPVDLGGLALWQQYVDSDGEAAGTLNRDTMVSLGAVPVLWHTPPRCRSTRPNLLSFLQDGPR